MSKKSFLFVQLIFKKNEIKWFSTKAILINHIIRKEKKRVKAFQKNGYILYSWHSGFLEHANTFHFYVGLYHVFAGRDRAKGRQT